VLEISRNLTPEQARIAEHWVAGPGTSAPPGMWNDIAVEEVRRTPLSFARMARVFALLNMAEADAGVAAWDCKYTYWSARPVNAIRDLGLDPEWEPLLPTPNFPAYVSGHSTFSAAGAEILAHFFPKRAAHLRRLAEEAGMSRIYGGIHYRSDNVVGLDMGRQIARLVLQSSGVGRSR
jgi:membrane-associated phospholipid phosphatase